MSNPDPFLQGIADGWQVHNASLLETDLHLETDVVIVGSGAGGATSAEILSTAGLRVLIVEEAHCAPVMTLRCKNWMPILSFTRRHGRMSKNGAISIMQGRSGRIYFNQLDLQLSATPQTLEHWAREHAVSG